MNHQDITEGQITPAAVTCVIVLLPRNVLVQSWMAEISGLLM